MKDDNHRRALANRLAEACEQLRLAEQEAIAALTRWDEMGTPADMLNVLRQVARKVNSFRHLAEALQREGRGK